MTRGIERRNEKKKFTINSAVKLNKLHIRKYIFSFTGCKLIGFESNFKNFLRIIFLVGRLDELEGELKTIRL